MTALAKGQKLVDRFVLIEPLAQGGRFEVWRSLDERRSAQVALKIVVVARLADSGEETARWEGLQREYSISRRLDHPGVVGLDEPIRDDVVLILPMTLAAGDLRALRGKNYTQIVPILIEVCNALDHLHSRGVVHRDLKPSNVLLDFTGRVRLADFEIAAVDGVAPPSSIGSPFSASPQQRRGLEPTALDDIYGVGALGYELLSAYPPYFPDQPGPTNEQVPPLKPVHPVPPVLHALLQQCLSSDCALRPASARELREQLAMLLSVRSEIPAIRVEPRSTNQKANSPDRSRRWIPWFASFVGLMILGATFWFLPRFAPGVNPAMVSRTSPAASEPTTPVISAQEQEQQTLFNERYAEFSKALEELESQAAGVWGGESFGAAKSMGELALAASSDRDLSLALDRLGLAIQRLTRIADERMTTLATLTSAANAAINDGRLEVARQNFERALLINPEHPPAVRGLQRIVALGPLLPALVEAETAQLAYDNLRALTLYEQVLRADPENTAAREGAARARRALSSDQYAAAIGESLAALRFGRIEVAGNALARARSLRADGAEIAALQTEIAALDERSDLDEERNRILDLERAENWSDAMKAYEDLLAKDRSLEFARVGRNRVVPRAELGRRLEALIGSPSRLSAPEVRREAQRLLAEAARIKDDAPVLRSQADQLSAAIQVYEKPVRTIFQSDGQTRIVVQRIGIFGAFTRKELELKPGRYVIVGTREGFRDVRREINVVPSGPEVIVDVRCTEIIS
ncbi:MAG: protein kinase domain-containing protein [Steroidobacteraceae bacterium]